MYKKIQENIEFFFGAGVGGKIYDAIKNANSSVFILTPYISQGYVDFLLEKKQQGINVSLVTTTEAQKGKMHEIYKKIVLQHRVTDEKKLIYKGKAKRRCLLLGIMTFIMGVAGIFWYDLHHHFHSIYKEIENFLYDDSVFVLTIMSILFISRMLYKKFHRIKIFDYYYSTRFSFSVIPSIYSQNMDSIAPMLDSFVHAKIYIVDKKDIFIGSANLTQKGLRHNIESFIKISAHDTVKEIMEDIDRYLNQNCSAINVNDLGPRVYSEAPY